MSTNEQDSLFFVSLPKSGTVYTWCSLRDSTGLKMPDFHLLEGWKAYNSGRDFSCPDLYACGDYNTQLLRPEQMKLYLKGYIFGAHMQASYHNMKILEESGIHRVSVLLRDPRDAFVSWVHHLRQLGLPARNYHSRIYHIPRDYYDWSLERQFDYQVRTFLPTIINWVEGWLDYYASADRKIDILFVFYDELKRDPESYVRKITKYHGIEDVDYSKLMAPEPGKMHFRKGEHEQWRVDLSTANQALALELLQDRILQGYNRAARSHPALAVAEAAVQRGDAAEAATAALEVVSQFSNYLPGYDVLRNALGLANVPTRQLDDLVHEEIGSLTTEGCFRSRSQLLEQARKLVREAWSPNTPLQTDV